MRRTSRSLSLAALAWIAVGTSNVAEAGDEIAVLATGACPSRDAVVAALAEAMPDATILGDAADVHPDSETIVVVSDDSPTYRAVVRGVVRTLVDDSNSCQERARKLAVVTALALEPPRVARRGPGELDTVTCPVPPPRRPLEVRVEAGGLVSYAEQRDDNLRPFGGTARVSVSRGALGLAVGVAASQLSVLNNGGIVQRFPIDVAVELRHAWRGLVASLELGPSFVVQREKNGDNRTYRQEIDLRASGQIELRLSGRIGVFAALTTTYTPDPPTLLASADTMPSWWHAVGAGIVIHVQ
jgi:hypothetical protein